MELTPEERQRIYEEEKARFEAQERLKAEFNLAQPKRNGAGGLRLGCLTLIGIVFALWLVGSCLSALDGNKEEKAQRAPVDTAQQERDFKRLMAAGIVTSIDVDRNPPRVYVGRPFYALDFQQREVAAKQVSDYWATRGGKPGGGALFDICDAYSGERLYSWEYYKLKQR